VEHARFGFNELVLLVLAQFDLLLPGGEELRFFFRSFEQVSATEHWEGHGVDVISDFLRVLVRVMDNTASDIHSLGLRAVDWNTSQGHKSTEFALHAAHVVRSTGVGHKTESGLVESDLCVKSGHWMGAGGQ